MDTPGWEHYRSFLAVIDHGSLSAAARELGLTQPTIGRHVAALEQTLFYQLAVAEADRWPDTKTMAGTLAQKMP